MGQQIADALEPRRQKRRRPRPPREDSDLPISDHIDRAYDLVPEAGEGLRWYDPPYRLLLWLLTGWRARLIPEFARGWLNDRLNVLLQYNEHDRNKVWSREARFENLFVPSDEHVTRVGVWVVELFPPTELPALERALVRNGWDRAHQSAPYRPDNLTSLTRSRAGGGATWWRVAEIVARGSKRVPLFDAYRMRLPAEFDSVEVRAIQAGQGLTAVIARFQPTVSAAAELDAIWHEPHEPILIRHRGRPHPLSRRAAAIRATRKGREALHTSARGWLAERLPGSFATNGEPQPLLEVILLEKFDPLAPRPAERDEATSKRDEALRALGLDTGGFHLISGKQLPGMILSQPRSHAYGPVDEGPTWTLWGSRETVESAYAGERAFHQSSIEAAVSRSVERAHNLLVLVAVAEYLMNAEAKYASLRDRASVRHGKFKAGALRELRRSFLTLSLNITTMRRDVDEFWRWSRTWSEGSVFKIRSSPRVGTVDEPEGRRSRKPTSFDRAVKKRLDERFARLTDVDRDYRDILSTVASLGASADAFKIGRWALWVAIASLVVASATILLADIGCGSILSAFFEWPSAAECAL